MKRAVRKEWPEEQDRKRTEQGTWRRERETEKEAREGKTGLEKGAGAGGELEKGRASRRKKEGGKAKRRRRQKGKDFSRASLEGPRSP